jgi:hypothetical protein
MAVARPPTLLFLLAVVTLGGCAKSQSPATTAEDQSRLPSIRTETRLAPDTSRDPCFEHMHDLVGSLLLYLGQHHDLPPRIQDLATADAGPGAWTCPVTEHPYVYNPNGFGAPVQGRVVAIDSVPHPNGVRWAITILDAAEGQPVIAKVIALPRNWQPPPLPTTR